MSPNSGICSGSEVAKSWVNHLVALLLEVARPAKVPKRRVARSIDVPLILESEAEVIWYPTKSVLNFLYTFDARSDIEKVGFKHFL